MFDPTDRRKADVMRTWVQSEEFKTNPGLVEPTPEVYKVAAKMLDYIEELEWSVGRVRA